MKNDGNNNKTYEQIKEILYIEMVHQQMETFIDIDKLLNSKKKSFINSKSQAL